MSLLYAKEITISVGAGQHWKEKREPQFAVWLEDSDGNFIRTLYVTERASHKSWIMSPKEGRPESLPVWYHASKHESSKTKKHDDKKAQLDAVTSATPKGGIIFNAEIEDKEYIIKAEFNTSFDYNDFYTKKNSGVNDQPSVIYSAKIPADFNNESDEIKLSFEGCGSIDGSDGTIHLYVSKLTTATEIVKLIDIKGVKSLHRYIPAGDILCHH
ncbi:DUF2271 domain-containing protein [Treponema sp.]|uniref:DUF2271 domain-containing protein n=1 Tax=Treponema sp. TaxID=166 RepID=UPI00298DA9A8|nr:DUF2271 domain-containing protein [Treponema sp.]MCR5613362.1 DUF2271 domain-containing protein [Treponema sp.]